MRGSLSSLVRFAKAKLNNGILVLSVVVRMVKVFTVFPPTLMVFDGTPDGTTVPVTPVVVPSEPTPPVTPAA